MLKELKVGQIVNTHGVKGEVKILPLTDNIERFKDLKTVKVESNVDIRKIDSVEFLSIKFHKNTVIAKLNGIDTLEKAEELKGLYLVVDRKDAVKLDKDSYFICDIIGLDVYDLKRGLLGKIEDVIQTGSNDVYVVKGTVIKELLIPAIKSVIKEVLIEEGRMNVDLIPGLIEDEV